MLDLRHNRISGPLPDSLGSLQQLRHLHLQGNRLEGLLPGGALHGLRQLQTIELQENLLYGELPDEVGDLASLRLLNLSNQTGTRRFEGALPDALTLLNSLAVLHIQHNDFAGVLPAQVWRMHSLEVFHAQHNQLAGPLPHGIGYLSNLRSLLLEHNEINGSVPDTLGGMSYLTEFTLDHNLLSGTLPAAAGHMPRLVTFKASHNRISGVLPTSIGDLKAIETMLMPYNNLEGPLPGSMGSMEALRTLDISFNNLTEALPTELGKLDALTHLYLNDNLPGLGGQDRVPGQPRLAIPESLGNLTNLRVFQLNNNSLKGELPAFLRRGPDGFKRHPDDGVNASREVGIVGNPYYCPLRPWALELFGGVECNHCPSDVDTTDFTFTCSGHGVCADGVCECEPLWAHFSTDCSMLGCPRVEEIDVDTGEEILQHCNGAGECYNTVNASAICGPNGKADFDYASAFAGRDIEQIIDGQAVAGPNVNGINDFVSQDVDCEAGVATFARCRCELGFVAPFCTSQAQAKQEAMVISAAPRAAPPPRLAAAAVATAAALALAAAGRRGR